MDFPEDLRKIIGLVQIKAGLLRSKEKGDLFQGVIDELKDKIEQGHAAAAELKRLASELDNYFATPAPKGKPKDNDGAINIVVHENHQAAYITLTPPRLNGMSLTLNKVLFALKDAGISYGIDLEIVRKAVDSCVLQKDIILMVKIAGAKPPKRGRPSSYELSVVGLDFDELAQQPARIKDVIKRLTRVKQGMLIAEYIPAIMGTFGITVKGEEIPPPKGDEVPFSFANNIHVLENKCLQANEEGVVVKKGTSIEIQELFYMRHSLEEPNRRLFFDGAVVIEGNVKGPLEIVAKEIIVTGKVERAKLYAKGDIFVFGGIFGKRDTIVTAGGKVITFSASDCVIEANEDILVAHNLYNSDVSTRGRLLISPKTGIIIGGSVNALHGVETKCYGSDFGIFSEAVVGKDTFSERKRKRLQSMVAGLKGKQELLNGKKQKILAIYKNISGMPHDKQDLFINLEQRLKQLEAEIDYFQSEAFHGTEAENDSVFSASIKVRDVLFPPFKAQICDAARDIDKKLQNVLLQYDQENGILVSNPKKND